VTLKYPVSLLTTAKPLVSRLTDGPPEALGSRGHFDVANAERGEGIDEGVGDGREGTDIAGFAGALDAERVGLGRHRIAGAMDRREVARPRHRIIHKEAGQELAGGGVEPNVLHQHLTHGLRDAAADLPFVRQVLRVQ
jgi:hypothetical protein